MKFIEIRPGCNINKDEIIKVESVDMMTCQIYTSIDVEDCIYPSWRILMLLETPDIEEKIASSPYDNPDISSRPLFGHGQHFAG